MSNVKEVWSEYNRIEKENDKLYWSIARALGLSDTAFGILYYIRNSEAELTQSDICTLLLAPKQTVNSALMKLTNEGIIELSCGKNRRCKTLRLTEKGEALASGTVDLVLKAEQRAMEGLEPGERETFLRLFRKLTDLTRDEFRGIGSKARILGKEKPT